MAFFIIQTEKDDKVIKLYRETKKRFKIEDHKINPYDNPKLKLLSFRKNYYLVFNMESLIPQVHKLAIITFLIMIMGYVLGWNTFGLVLSFATLLLLSSMYFRSGHFYGLVFRLALRRKGYKGKIKYLDGRAWDKTKYINT